MLGLSVAITHSFVVMAISAAALWVGQESFTVEVTRWLQIISGVVVVLLGSWLLFKRLRQQRRSRQPIMTYSFQKVDEASHAPSSKSSFVFQPHLHDHDHDNMTDDEHARAHAATIPHYAIVGQRPTLGQIIMFGAAGGMIPCPASITVMLLALSLGKFGFGMLAVAGFSIGLAVTLVGIGLAVVMGISRLQGISRFSWVSKQAPVLSAFVVILSGIAALAFVH